MQEHASLEPLARDTPQTKRGHERCLALLLSANELFLERGYDAVSLDDIVNHAGGSKASIYKYFGSKEGLFKAICDYRRDQFFKDICMPFNPELSDFRNYLIQTLINFQTHLKQPDKAAFMRLVLEQSQRNPELALHIHEQGPKHIQLAIASALEKGHQKGLLVCDNPMFSAQFYFGILRNIEWKILMGVPTEESDQESIKYISYCVDRFLEGHQPR
ncbi:TetR/AcrR family transcriptional regulator [Acinetobacter bouvetii]|uniref:HTH-type transcriptional repressor ComR n=1 Tax=Acinetobacter bouvetii TaxID=202951 RepID=A0A811G8F5_9GAMM|nr:TetR/AcrR family transcriptional regulator [Acinetobacter bouvetii]CAB1212605.1 HTH-type transcriptional repressor ComR [Acinetobacter bouvetii]